MLTRLFFETPWWFPTLIAVLGAGLCWIGDVRRRGGLLYAGLFVFVLAAAVIVISSVVETDAELAADRSRQLAAAIQSDDEAAIRSILSARCTVTLGGEVVYHDREELLANLPSLPGKFEVVRQLKVFRESVQPQGQQIMVTLAVESARQFRTDSVVTAWALHWEQPEPGRWEVVEIAAAVDPPPSARQ